ncbi:DUF1697 domain-containing protein [Sphingosinicella sp. LHD-64]|uniref:DUF1697 domain-containing protein n=1 Tax=Sphingosinicella sp. LHD-64 TaxID=3072139 RepID=UPI00280DEB03|nr:DUF1697 domain-containing protein [Sphingosinicella sp. LHD-64]MDQ8756001.1 DUF1697 domain-containing protein [Sphingosinicella sp. LHD-64]
MGRMVALLRAVNVGGRKLPMAELRTLCGALGWTDVATYIQSGNVVFDADCTPAEAETTLEGRIASLYGYEAPTVVRTARQWAAYAPACPFPEEAIATPNYLLLLVSKRPPVAAAVDAIQARAAAGEQVRQSGDGIWIHFPNGSGTSKITPTIIDRAIGSPATSRNYRTVVTLQEMLET